MERWIGSCRREFLDQTVIWNEAHLLRVLREYEAHHSGHRPHRSLAQAAPLQPHPFSRCPQLLLISRASGYDGTAGAPFVINEDTLTA
jgi:hypothetical protein